MGVTAVKSLLQAAAAKPALALLLSSILTPPPQEDELLAYQICFDLVENEMQSFLIRVGLGFRVGV